MRSLAKSALVPVTVRIAALVLAITANADSLCRLQRMWTASN